MPKPRTPSAVLEARGAFAKDPARRREDFQAGEFEREAPAYFNEGQRQVWDEIVDLLPAEVLQSTDRMAVELTSRLIARFRDLEDDKVTMAQVAQIRTALASLGMTPADRSRVSAKKKAPTNAFLALVTKKT
jgi:phage terminase small subunit